LKKKKEKWPRNRFSSSFFFTAKKDQSDFAEKGKRKCQCACFHRVVDFKFRFSFFVFFSRSFSRAENSFSFEDFSIFFFLFRFPVFLATAKSL